jgi:hypothetical protein
MAIQWRNDLETAYQEAKAQNKLVLVDLFNPG